MAAIENLNELGHLIDGRLVRTDQTFDVVDPRNGQVFAVCPQANDVLVEEAMAAANRAQGHWAEMGEVARRDVLRSMAAALAEHVQEIVNISAQEKGSLQAAYEAFVAPGFAKDQAEISVPVDIIEDSEDRTVRVVRKPVGVVVAICPWNAPILITTEKIFAALATGNTVVVKPSPFTPLATLALGSIWKDIVPNGVLNILAGPDELGVQLVDHPSTSMISFTGSVAAGRAIAASAGRSLKRVLLELGGNDAAIVLPDVDVASVAEQVFSFAFGMGGQVCAAIKRLYVHEDIFDEMVTALAKLAGAVVVAPEEDGGQIVPISTKPQFDRICMLASDAIASGATVVSGGAPVDHSGYFFPPTILTGITTGTRVVDEEQFGPLLPVIPYSNVDEAIAMANATEYGLSGSIWTADIKRGEELANRLECGTSIVNGHAEISPHIPFGGTKTSGIGRAGGLQGVDGYSELQTQYVYKSPAKVS